MHKDSRGFLWFGTGYGLNRFDGKEFEWFFPKESLQEREKDDLASNFIHHIFEDADGWLWLITLKNEYDLSSFYIRSISFLNIHTGEIKSLSEKFGEDLPIELFKIQLIRELPDESLLFVSETGKCTKYLPKSGFRSFQLEFAYHKIIDLIPLSANSFWTVVNLTWEPPREVLIKTDTTGKILKQIEKFPLEDTYFVGEDTQNRLWFGLELDGNDIPPIPTYFLSENEELVIPDWSTFNLPWGKIGIPPKFRAVYTDPSIPYFWSKANNQFFVFDIEGNLIYDFGNAPLSRDERWDLRILFDGNTAWMTDGKSGLSAIELYPNHFKKYLHGDPNSDSDNFSCRGIVSDKFGRIWVGTYSNAQLIDKENQTISPIKEIDYPAITKDRQGNIWTYGYDGLVQFKFPDFEPEYFTYNEYRYGDFWAIYEDRQGLIWYSKGADLFVLNPETKKSRILSKQKDFPDFGDTYFYFITQKDENSLWLAGDRGLFVYHYEKGIIAQYNSDQKNEFYIPAKDIHHLCKDADGVIWLATGDEGLIRWTMDDEQQTEASTNLSTVDRPPPIIQQFTIANGLSSNVLHSVYEDDFNHLWMSSENGVIQFNKTNFSVKNYFLEDGITDNEFNRISHYQDEDGTIYFGSVNGITAFHPKDFYQNEEIEYNAPLEILSFQQFSSEIDSLEDRTMELAANGKIELQPGDRFFNLKPALLDYENSERIQYVYRMEGLNKKWTTTRNNELTFNGLPYGEYILKIKAHNGNGRFSKNKISIPVEVIRPIYLRWWFLILAFLGTVATGFFFLKWRTNRLIQQRNLLEKQVEERTKTISKQAEELRQLDKVKSRFFANVSHELRTPLTLMLAPISSLLKGKEDKNRQQQLLKLAQNNGRHLLKLINEILDLTKLESGKLELKETGVLLHPFLTRLVSSFESYAQQKKIDFRFYFKFDKELYVFLDMDKFEIIVNNLLSNAFKFTPPEGKIEVHVSEDSNIQITIKDSGQGIHSNDLPYIFDRFYQSKQPDAPTQGGTGIGLALCREYVSLFNGKIWAQSELGNGSSFFVEIPKRLSVVNYPVSIENHEIESNFEAQSINNDFQVIEKNTQNNTPELATDTQEDTTILIVEDNQNLRKYLTSILEKKYLIQTAENGKEALQILNEYAEIHHSPFITHHLIISDVMMPIMDGFTFLNHVKSNEKLRHIPMIMLTARAEKEDKLRALRIGVDDYILKPFEEDELLVRIENLLKNSEERRQFFETEMKENQFGKESINIATTISQEDQLWLEKLEQTVKKQIGNFDFTTEGLAFDMAISRRQLNRRIKKLTGLSTGEYVREVRLQEARRLLENRKYSTVKSVAYSVGLKSLDYFSKQFKERFGVNPSKYL